MNVATPGALIDKYLEIRDFVKTREDAHKVELKPYEEALQTIENAVHGMLIEAKLDNFKAPGGTAYRQAYIATKTVDRTALFQFCLDEFEKTASMGAFDILTNAVSKEFVKTYLDENKKAPPGVDVTQGYRVNFRKA